MKGKFFLKEKIYWSCLHLKMQKMRGNDISMIFQDPLSSLNPVYTIGDQIRETIWLHQAYFEKRSP